MRRYRCPKCSTEIAVVGDAKVSHRCPNARGNAVTAFVLVQDPDPEQGEAK